MSKLLKLLFNRITIVLILLVLQVTIIVLALQEASQYFMYLDILLRIISFIYGLKLLTKDVSTTIKLPTFLLLMVFPFIGIFVYYFSFENKMRKKLVRNLKNQTFTLESLYVENPDIKDQLFSEDKMMYRQSQYIANNTFLPVYTNVETSYYKSGEDFFDSLIEDLKSAKDFIFLEFFIIGKRYIVGYNLRNIKAKN